MKTSSTLDQAAQDHHRLFSRSPNLEKFSNFLIRHQVFVDCEREILQRVARPGVANILLVIGPTGAGKTQLLDEVTGILDGVVAPSPPRLSLANSIPARPYLPVVSVLANSGRTFESRFKHLLIEILKQVNAVATELGVTDADAPGNKIKRTLPIQQTPIAQLEQLVRSGLKERQVRAVLIDEAQHLAQSADADDWQLVAHGLKLLGSVSGTLIVLFGTWELLPLPLLTGALGRRTACVHFRRYLWNDSLYPREFERVVTAFANAWPKVLPLKLLMKNLSFLYTGCVGCVGNLSGWLGEAMALAEQEEAPSVTLEILQRRAHSEAKLRQWDQEALKCENAFKVENAGFNKFIAELCPSSGARSVFPPDPINTARPVSRKKTPKPGNRNPAHDRYISAAAA